MSIYIEIVFQLMQKMHNVGEIRSKRFHEKRPMSSEVIQINFMKLFLLSSVC